MREPRGRRAATVCGLFTALFLVRFAIDRPTFIGASFLLVVPVVLAALWFGVRGGIVVAFAGALGFFVAEEVDPSVAVATHTIVIAALVRGGGLALVGVIVARLFARQVAITRELEELEATRDALRPASIAPRPGLDLAAHYVPVQDGVGGDFYVAVEGPRGSTVLVVGDVVGKGVVAAQRAVFVRTSLVTFAPFEDDPARLLQLANAALIERAGTSLDYVTAACVVHRPADATLAWALAGHHAPLALDTGRELEPGGAGQPLGLDHELALTGLSMPLAEDSGVLLYTDGILDARDGHGRRFGEERLSALVREYGGDTAAGVVEHLKDALAGFSPAAGDDVCLLAARNRSATDWREEAAPVGSGTAG
jgi:sigma-B regulation protein RsbU (phosphoserine phosphatase)